MSFRTRSFCRACGQLRRVMNEGFESDFFDRGVCPNCGDGRSGRQVVTKREGFLRARYIDREGVEVTPEYIKGES